MTTFLYILLAILAFGLLIFIHELGHFLVARACGVAISEFAIGMGPRLFGWKGKDGTAYNLRLFPVGGFVSMKGEDEEAEGEDSFNAKKPWQRFLIVAAGAFMNILLAFVLMLIVVLTRGGLLGTTVVNTFSENATSNACLAQGDRILSVNGSRVHTWQETVYEISHDGYEPIDLTVSRDGQTVELHDVVFPTQVSSGMLFGSPDFLPYGEVKSIGNVLAHTYFYSLSTVKMIWESLLDLIFGRVSVEAVSGPVGVTSALGDAARDGAQQFFYLVSVLAMNLGVVNLLPLPALDGGRLVFILFEMIFRRKVNPKYEGMVHFVGIVLLLALMAAITFKDIASLIGG